MSYIIYNIRPIATNLSASEFIQKNKILTGQITNHGLGSGLYGYSNLPNNNNNIIIEEIELKNPIILDTEIKFNKFISASTKLNNLVQNIIKKIPINFKLILDEINNGFIDINML